MRRTLPFIIHVVYFLAHCAIGIRALSVTGGERAAALNRRDFFSTATSTAATVTVTAAGLAFAADAAVDGGTIRPIGIVGANGRTGALCVASCLRRGIPVRALTRSGSWSSPSGEEYNMDNMVDDKLLSIQQCDARDISALETGISGCSVVIYAASVSKKGGKEGQGD
uniref:NAD(P)-binding domain-containing protein n=1 Tax=Eucampia antarctica TaxID=49252 RepID=A0A7S2SDY9_9STRA|mmetsp:Transcript_6879/g.6502  ORF Transcript_6879/g.6502 Transcript_6879/m.6502 type:complete len:168 (+) Transcript_6879:83-586(+)